MALAAGATIGGINSEDTMNFIVSLYGSKAFDENRDGNGALYTAKERNATAYLTRLTKWRDEVLEQEKAQATSGSVSL
jgi:hypothetical protein